MAERSTVTQVVQIGAESVPGTAVPCDTRLGSMSIMPNISAEIDMFRPAGYKFATVQALNKEWSALSMEGKPVYDEVIYPLSSVLCVPDVSTPIGASTAVQYDFEPDTNDVDTPATYTIEQGSSVRAHRSTYGLFTDWSIDVSRDAVDQSGSLIARAIDDGVTMEASPNSLPLIPMLPGQASLYLDDTSGQLGTTKLTRGFSLQASIAGRWNPLWVVDAAEDSFATHVESAPTAQVQLTLAANAQGMGLLGTMRTGATKFLRLEFVGGEIEAGHNYRFRLDAALKVSAVQDFSDDQDVQTVGWTLDLVHDASWGRALAVRVVNTLAALGS